MRNIRFSTLKFFKRRLPVMTLKGGTIVNMNSVIYSKFPPGLRKASIKTYCLSFIHDCPDEALSTTVLLVHVRYACKYTDSLFFKERCEFSEFEFTPCIDHNFNDNGVIFGFHHSNILPDRSISFRFELKVLNPSMRCTVVKEYNVIFVSMV